MSRVTDNVIVVICTRFFKPGLMESAESSLEETSNFIVHRVIEAVNGN